MPPQSPAESECSELVDAAHELLPLAVIVTHYNQPDLLTLTLDSVAAQKPRPSEVFVVDDGSTEDPRPIVDTHPCFVLIRQENRGPGAARNAGWKASKQPFLLFLDHDDLLLPGRVGLGIWRAPVKPGGRFLIWTSPSRARRRPSLDKATAVSAVSSRPTSMPNSYEMSGSPHRAQWYSDDQPSRSWAVGTRTLPSAAPMTMRYFSDLPVRSRSSIMARSWSIVEFIAATLVAMPVGFSSQSTPSLANKHRLRKARRSSSRRDLRGWINGVVC